MKQDIRILLALIGLIILAILSAESDAILYKAVGFYADNVMPGDISADAVFSASAAYYITLLFILSFLLMLKTNSRVLRFGILGFAALVVAPMALLIAIFCQYALSFL